MDLAFRIGEAVEPRTISLTAAKASFRLPLPGRPDAVEVDPEGWLLHERRSPFALRQAGGPAPARREVGPPDGRSNGSSLR